MPGFAFLGGSIPARVVGGDFYDFIPFEDGRLGIVIGDVSGKSVPASLLMVAAKEIVYSRALTTRDPGVLFQESNRRIYAIKRRMFVSLGFFLLDAGRDEPALRHRRPAPADPDPGGRRRSVFARSSRAPAAPRRLPGGGLRHPGALPEPGDLLFFYTDGFTEAMDADMNPYGEERLMASVEARKDGPLDEVANGVLRISGTSWRGRNNTTT